MYRFTLLLLFVMLILHIPYKSHSAPLNSDPAAAGIAGTVTDAEGNVIDRVSIFIPELKIGTYTDSAGEYELAHLPAGNFAIEYSHLGYGTVVRTVDLKGEQIKRDVMLSISPIQMKEIVVTAPYATLPEETPYEIAAISEKEIQYSGATTMTEAMTHIAGVSQLSTGDGIAKPVIRGLHGNRILTVIEGFRFDNQQWQDEHGLGLSGMGLNSVEMLKGPASLLYGADALGGVLNLVDEKPAPIGTTVSDYNVRLDENTLGLNTDVGIKGSTDQYYWKLRLGGDSHADYLDGNNARVPNTRFNGLNLKTNFGVIRKKLVSNFNYHFSSYQFGVVEQNEGEKKNTEEERFGREMEEAYHGVNYHLLTTQNTYFAGASKIKLDAGAHLNNRKEQEGPEEQALGNLDMQLNTYSGNLRYVSPSIFRSGLTAGIEATSQSNRNNGARVIVPNANTREISAYGYFRHELDRLIIEEGIRFNNYHIETVERGIPDSTGYIPALDRSYSPVNGSVGFSYNLAEHLLFKGNFATGYRAPNLAELSSNGLHEGTLNYEIGDAGLKSEQNNEIDFGLHYHSVLVSIDASVFRNDFNHYIFLSPTNESRNGFRVYRFLQTDAVLKGGEISLDWRPAALNRLTFRHSFSILDGRQSDGTYLPLMPANTMRHEVKINTDIWKIFSDGYLKFGTFTAFNQKNVAPAETATPGYTLLNIEMGGHIFGGKIYGTLAVTNLLGKVYYDHLSRIKPGNFNDPDVGFYNMGRNFTIALHVPLIGQQ